MYTFSKICEMGSWYFHLLLGEPWLKKVEKLSSLLMKREKTESLNQFQRRIEKWNENSHPDYEIFERKKQILNYWRNIDYPKCHGLLEKLFPNKEFFISLLVSLGKKIKMQRKWKEKKKQTEWKSKKNHRNTVYCLKKKKLWRGLIAFVLNIRFTEHVAERLERSLSNHEIWVRILSEGNMMLSTWSGGRSPNAARLESIRRVEPGFGSGMFGGGETEESGEPSMVEIGRV